MSSTNWPTLKVHLVQEFVTYLLYKSVTADCSVFMLDAIYIAQPTAPKHHTLQ